VRLNRDSVARSLARNTWNDSVDARARLRNRRADRSLRTLHVVTRARARARSGVATRGGLIFIRGSQVKNKPRAIARWRRALPLRATSITDLDNRRRRYDAIVACELVPLAGY